MKKVLFSLVTVMLILTSCGADAVKFNDAIVKEQKALEVSVMEYNSKLQTMNVSPESFKELGDSLLMKIDKSIDVIKGLNTPSGGEKFKESTLVYFESAKQLVEMGNKAKSLGTEPTEEQAMAFMQEMTAMQNDMVGKENAFLAAQKEFAKEKNMKLQ
jgi:hypothetical protein